MGVSTRRASSRDLRMAAMRPSIMSEGAMMSAPAWAQVTAICASSGSVGALWGRVRAGLGAGDGHLRQQWQGGPIEDVPALEDATVAMIGVLAQAHVRDDLQLGDGLLDGADGALDDAVARIALGAPGVLVAWDAEE